MAGAVTMLLWASLLVISTHTPPLPPETVRQTPGATQANSGPSAGTVASSFTESSPGWWGVW